MAEKEELKQAAFSLGMTELLTVKETAAYLRTSLQQVRRMIREGDLFAVKVGREYRIPLSALAEFLEGG